jgi:hypothetical protein
MRRKFGVVILFCLLVITSSTGLRSQITSTTMYGQVEDPTGALLASAQVSVTNIDTNLSRTV